MTIPDPLKQNLIADVENTLNLHLSDQQKIELGRAFEVTVGSHIPQTNIPELRDPKAISKTEFSYSYYTDHVNKLYHYFTPHASITKCGVSIDCMTNTKIITHDYKFCKKCLSIVKHDHDQIKNMS